MARTTGGVSIPVSVDPSGATKGIDEVKKSAEGLEESFDGTAKAAADAGDEIDQQLDDIEAGFEGPKKEADLFGIKLSGLASILGGALLIGGTVSFFASCVKDALEASGKLDEFKGKMDELKVAIGQAFLPAVQPVLDLLIKLATWFGNLPGPIQTIISVLGFAIPLLAGLAMVIGPLIPLLGALAGVTWAAAGPWLLVAAAIAAVVAIIIVCIKYHEEIWAAMKVAWNAIKDAFITAWEAIKSAWDAVLEWLGGIKDAILGFFSGAIDWLKEKGSDIINGLWNGIKAIWELVAGWYLKLGQVILAFFTSASTWLVEKGGDIITGLWDGIKSIWESVASWFRGLYSAARDFFSGAGTWLYDAGKAILQGLWDGLKALWTSIWEWMCEIARKIASWLSSAESSVGQGARYGRAGMVSRQSGGPIPGVGAVPIMAHGGEYVLTKGDTSLMKQLIAKVGTGGNTFIIHASGQGEGQAAADAFLKRVAAAGVQL